MAMKETIKTALIEDSVYLVSKRHNALPPFIYQLTLQKSSISMFLVQNQYYRLPFPTPLGTVVKFDNKHLRLGCDFITPWSTMVNFDLAEFYVLPSKRFYQIIKEHYFVTDFEGLMNVAP